MNDYPAIRAALRGRLFTVEGVDEAQFASQNRPFKPTIGTSYVRETFLPASEPQVAAAHTMAVGLVQYDVMCPAGEGTEEAEALVVRIGNAFKPCQHIAEGPVSVEVVRSEPRTPNKADGAWFMFPIQITWRCYHPLS